VFRLVFVPFLLGRVGLGALPMVGLRVSWEEGGGRRELFLAVGLGRDHRGRDQQAHREDEVARSACEHRLLLAGDVRERHDARRTGNVLS
jgi:hypothetical protein